MAEVLRDAVFYHRSGGGMTLTGGEPLFQPDFAMAIFQVAKAHGVHSAVETCGYVPWQSFQLALRHIDLLLFDLKLLSPELHQRMTGVTNALILQNLGRVVSNGVNLILRLPIIPGVNDSAGDMEAIGRIVSALRPVPPVELLPYHRLGVSKYRALGREYRLEARQPPDKSGMKKLGGVLAQMGLEVI